MKPQLNKKSETLFIGTSHIDPCGYGRLTQIMESIKPEMILLEVSHMSIILRRTYGFICRLILNHNLKAAGIELNPGIQNIISYLGIPYEYAAARDYCIRTGAVYRLVDVSIISLARFFMHINLYPEQTWPRRPGKNMTGSGTRKELQRAYSTGMTGSC